MPLLYSACLVTVEVEAVAINVLHCELPQTPRFLFKRLNDPRARRTQFFVCGVNVCNRHPVNGRFEGLGSLAKENRDIVTRYSTDLLSGVEPTNLETECITVVLLSPFHIRDWQLRSRVIELCSQFLLVHNILLRVLRCITPGITRRPTPRRNMTGNVSAVGCMPLLGGASGLQRISNG